MKDVERRNLLLAAAGGTLLAMSQEASAQVAAKPKATTATVAKEVTAKELKTSTDLFAKAKSLEGWKKLKARVNEISASLAPFDVSFMEGALSKLKEAQLEEKTKLTHNPRLVEPLLGEIASLLDRCISYRREGSELELAGISAGANRIAAATLHAVDREMAAVNITGDVATTLANEYQTAAAAFGGAGELGKGHAQHLRADTSGNQKLASLTTDRLQKSVDRLAFTQELELQLLARHDVPGNAHNFSERFEQLRGLFNSDIISAYRRALAVSAGMENLFEKPPVLDLANPNFLDDFVIWTRTAMRLVTRIAESEVEYAKDFVVTVPVGTSNGSATLQVDPNSFQGFKYVRLRSIAGFYATDTAPSDANQLANGSVSVAMVKSSANIGPRIIIPLTNVRWWLSGRDPQTHDNALLYNADPRGTWTLRMNTNGLKGDGTAWARADLIKRLIVRFQVVAIPDPEVDGTFFASEDRV